MLSLRCSMCSLVATLAFLPACGKDSPAPAPTTDSRAAADTSKPADKTAASTKPAAAAPPAVAADTLEGPPPADVKMAKTIAHAKEYSLGVPAGWEGSDNAYEGMLNATTKDAAVMLHDVGPGAVSDANRDFWAKGGMASTEIKWEPDAPGTVGKSAIPGKVAKGVGKLQGAPAEDVDLSGGDLLGGEACLGQGVEARASDVVHRRAQNVAHEALADDGGREGVAQVCGLRERALGSFKFKLGEALGRKGFRIDPGSRGQRSPPQQSRRGVLKVETEHAQTAPRRARHNRHDHAVAGFGIVDGSRPGLSVEASAAEPERGVGVAHRPGQQGVAQ